MHHRGLWALCALLAVVGAVWAQAVPAPYREVEKILGRNGEYKDKVFTIKLPRDDIGIAINGRAVPPSFGFTGDIMMTAGQRGTTIAMGEFVLLQHEVNPVTSALLEQKLAVGGVHNHFLWETPRIIFLHFQGQGTAADLARRIKPALDLVGKAPKPAWIRETIPPAPTTAFPANTLDTAQLDRIIHHQGKPQEGGVYEYEIDRNDLKVTLYGTHLPAGMDLMVQTQFLGSMEDAWIAAEMPLLSAQVPAVERAVRAAGLDLAAVHFHMLNTNPMVIYLHFEGNGRAVDLATGFRAALTAAGIK